MSNETNVSKNLTNAARRMLSRRDAVKKAGSITAGAALAYLGLGLCGISQQKTAAYNPSCTGCGAGCGGGCSISCTGCTGSCQGACLDTCAGGCSATCMGVSNL